MSRSLAQKQRRPAHHLQQVSHNESDFNFISHSYLMHNTFSIVFKASLRSLFPEDFLSLHIKPKHMSFYTKSRDFKGNFYFNFQQIRLQGRNGSQELYKAKILQGHLINSILVIATTDFNPSIII